MSQCGRNERYGLKHEIEYGYDADKILIFVDDPKFKFMLECPR